MAFADGAVKEGLGMRDAFVTSVAGLGDGLLAHEAASGAAVGVVTAEALFALNGLVDDGGRGDVKFMTVGAQFLIRAEECEGVLFFVDEFVTDGAAVHGDRAMQIGEGFDGDVTLFGDTGGIADVIEAEAGGLAEELDEARRGRIGFGVNDG